ncbi:autotransporter outer membrane beta-barrel domain-containing protein [Rhodothalassium salexigens]|uniref:autotransporter outer membrane beta-barrel domain-containing protein n=1 Tax=Rhodothalassium salexigens TaxID=1086 RepID=UPI00191250B4|nr:autotransporter domain-containing protein [Rhodothalassium salexigens]
MAAVFSRCGVARRRAVSILAVCAAAGAALHPAAADDLEVDGAREEPARTSDLDGTGPGDLSVLSSGQITVDTVTAVFLDSDNLLSNAGVIESVGFPDAVVVDVDTGVAGIASGIDNTGTIRVGGTEDDPITGANRGLAIRGDGAFTGDLSNGGTGTIAVSGAGSIAIDIASDLNGTFRNEGAVSASGDGSIAVRTAADLGLGYANIGSTTAAAVNGSATSVLIDDGGRMTRLLNNGELLAEIVNEGDTAGRAVGVEVLSGGRLERFENNGRLAVAGTGAATEAVAIIDRSGTLGELANRGTISAQLSGAGDTRAVAIDLSANTGGVTLTNTGRFTGTEDGDDDGNFGFVAAQITGDVVLGAGDDEVAFAGAQSAGRFDFGAGDNSFTLTTLAGTGDAEGELRGSLASGRFTFGAGDDTVSVSGSALVGAVDLGAGQNSVTLVDGARFSGTLVGGDRTTLLVDGAALDLTGEAGAQVAEARLLGESSLSVALFTQEQTAATLDAGDLLVTSDALDVSVAFDNLPGDGDAYRLSTADTIDFTGDLAAVDLTSNITDLLFETNLSLAEGTRDTLLLTVNRRSNADLDINASQGVVFDAVLPATANDAALGLAIGGLEEAAGLRTALDQLSPQYTGAVRTAALVGQAMGYGAVARRLDAVRGFDRYAAAEFDTDQPLSADQRVLRRDRERRFGLWGQQLLQLMDRDGLDNRPGYDGYALGFAVGVDFPFFGLDALGVSFTQIFSETKEDVTADGDLFGSSSQFTLYGSYSLGGFFVDAMGGIGLNDYENSREVTAGNLNRVYDSDWNATQLLGSGRIGYRAQLGRFGLTLSGDAFYTKLDEDGYTERLTADGSAEDPDDISVLSVDGRDTTSFRVGARAVIDAEFQWSRTTKVIPVLRGGVLTELEDDPIRTVARFDGGDPFTLEGRIGDTTTLLGGASVVFQSGYGSLSIDYDIEYAGDFTAHTSGITFRLEF